MSGLFIVFEGGDGAGKSTQVDLLMRHLQECGQKALKTFEPGATPLGKEIRNLLLHANHAIDSKTEALLYAADRAQHVSETVLPALAAGTVVVQDRYIDSSLAYQGAGRILEVDDIAKINEWASGGLKPNLTVLLDIDPREAAKRRESRGEKPDRLESEKLSFHEAVRQGFLDRAAIDPSKYLVLDASKNVDAIFTNIKDRVNELLDSCS